MMCSGRDEGSRIVVTWVCPLTTWGVFQCSQIPDADRCFLVRMSMPAFCCGVLDAQESYPLYPARTYLDSRCL